MQFPIGTPSKLNKDIYILLRGAIFDHSKLMSNISLSDNAGPDLLRFHWNDDFDSHITNPHVACIVWHTCNNAIESA